MSSPNDFRGSSDGAPLTTANAVNGPVRNPRPKRKRHLRLVDCQQILGKSHERQNRQSRRNVKAQSGEKPENAIRGYSLDMAQRPALQQEPEAITPIRAIARALQKVVPPRGVAQAAEITGISHSQLNRLRKGQQKDANVSMIEKLRRYPGFSAEFDRLMANTAPPVDYIEVARRLSAVYGIEGAERIVFQLESLARFLDAESVSNLLKEQTKMLSRLLNS